MSQEQPISTSAVQAAANDFLATYRYYAGEAGKMRRILRKLKALQGCTEGSEAVLEFQDAEVYVRNASGSDWAQVNPGAIGNNSQIWVKAGNVTFYWCQDGASVELSANMFYMASFGALFQISLEEPVPPIRAAQQDSTLYGNYIVIYDSMSWEDLSYQDLYYIFLLRGFLPPITHCTENYFGVLQVISISGNSSIEISPGAACSQRRDLSTYDLYGGDIISVTGGNGVLIQIFYPGSNAVSEIYYLEPGKTYQIGRDTSFIPGNTTLGGAIGESGSGSVRSEGGRNSGFRPGVASRFLEYESPEINGAGREARKLLRKQYIDTEVRPVYAPFCENWPDNSDEKIACQNYMEEVFQEYIDDDGESAEQQQIKLQRLFLRLSVFESWTGMITDEQTGNRLFPNVIPPSRYTLGGNELARRLEEFYETGNEHLTPSGQKLGTNSILFDGLSDDDKFIILQDGMTVCVPLDDQRADYRDEIEKYWLGTIDPVPLPINKNRDEDEPSRPSDPDGALYSPSLVTSVEQAFSSGPNGCQGLGDERSAGYHYDLLYKVMANCQEFLGFEVRRIIEVGEGTVTLQIGAWVYGGNTSRFEPTLSVTINFIYC